MYISMLVGDKEKGRMKSDLIRGSFSHNIPITRVLLWPQLWLVCPPLELQAPTGLGGTVTYDQP
jgi:hypothetical protein